MKPPSAPVFSVFLVMLLLVSYAQNRPASPAARILAPAPSSPTPSPGATVQPDPTRTIGGGQVYTDAKLGFQLTVPRTWQAQPQPGSQSSPNNTAVTFTVDEHNVRSLIIIGVFHRKTMPAAFSQRGTPTIHIGPYSAFIADHSLREARAPCLVRIFLAREDYVLADWCPPTAFAYGHNLSRSSLRISRLLSPLSPGQR